jgi:rare lipoprotein A
MRLTASGRRYNQHEFTAASLTYPFGTWLRLRHVDNGLTVDVMVTDRGPFVIDRDLDLSWAAARKLGMIRDGLAMVEVEVL